MRGTNSGKTRTGIRRARGKANGLGAGDAGFIDSEDFGAGADAWMGDFAANSHRLARSAAGESRRVVSGAAPLGAKRLDQSALGRVRKQPQGEILRADACRQEVHGQGRSELGASVCSDWAGAKEHLGNLR